MCCAVLGICRSIWNKFRFDCCGQCSTTKIPSQMTRDFLRGQYRTRTARPRRRRGKQQPSGLLLSPRFPIFRNVYQESTACRSTVCRASVGQYRTGTMYVRAIRKKQKTGYHRCDGILPFVLYGAFWVNRCVRRKKGKL